MKTHQRLALCVLLSALVSAGSAPALAQTPSAPMARVASVPAVELARYTGKWFEMASFPMFFQRKCLGDTTAEYAALPDGAISVNNRCRTESGYTAATGKATVVEGSGNARLKVSFFWPFKADYWVIGLDPEYRWAVVGNPNREYLWVLSRTPQLAPELMKAALASASAQGFDLDQLKTTVHTATP